MNRVIAFALFLACLLWSGCAVASASPTDVLSPPPDNCARAYAVSPKFSMAELEMIDRANSAWNAITRERYCLYIGEYVTHSIRKEPHGGPEWIKASELAPGLDVIGIYTTSSDSVVIFGTAADPYFYRVALHELGHARGLGHIPVDEAIMSPSVNASQSGELTNADLAECRRVEACR